jgi:RNA polymerase sigma factor (sigma-70 family)
MEQILNDHADAHYAKKRGGKERRRVALNGEADQSTEERGAERLMDERLMVTPAESETVIGVREALGILRRVSPRQAEVLQLQFYGGLTQEEIAGILHVSLETVKLDTRKAKALLKVHLASRTK